MNDPVQTPAKEDVWWSNLEGDEIGHNLHGNPPYDVEAVAERIIFAHPYAGRILDMGCGIGRLTREIADQMDTSSVLAFDISGPSIFRAAEHNSHILYWHSDGRTIPSGITGTFDLIYSITMFQHIPHDAKWNYIVQAGERLRPGGAFVFTVAVGDEPPSFLNHQLTRQELEDFASAMTNLFETVSVDHDPVTDWWWVEARA